MNTTRGNVTHLPTNHLNIIVGSNDVGKSNYLKALNLFFNHQSDPETYFNFWEDYSYQRHGVRREKNRIEIELIISPPKKQYFQSKGDVKWTKTWRENSSTPEELIEYVDGSKFKSDGRSSYYKWLKKLRYKYVPAIKSQEYFNKLIHTLYDVLQSDTKALEEQFNKQIKEKTVEISNQLIQRLNLESVLQFKGDFRKLFNNLEFSSKDGKNTLKQRGDGIKIRHIPIILQSIAEAEFMSFRKKYPVASTIWGFEEPENNLEFDSAKKLADSFLEYIEKIHFQNTNSTKFDEGIQIFLTTHSPVFYTLANLDSDKIQSFLVSKSNDESSIIKPLNNQQSKIIEDEMKLRPLIELTTYWQKISLEMESLNKQNEALEKIKKTISDNKQIVFLTEDTHDGLLETLLKANGFDLNKVDLRSYNSCTKIGSAIVFYKYLKDKYSKNCPVVIVHRDKDYLPPKEISEEISKFKKEGIELFITQGTDIESYFVNPTHIEHCHPEITNQKINELINNAKQEHREYAIKRIKAKEYGDKHKEKHSHLGNLIPEYYDKNEDKLFPGKKVFNKLKNTLKNYTEGKKNPNLNSTSDALKDLTLEALAKKIMSKS